MKKRLTGMILMVMALVCVMTVGVSATESGDVSGLNAAIAAGTEYALTANITVESPITIDKNMTIDVGIFTLSVNDFAVEEGVTFTLTGSYVGGYGYMHVLGDAVIDGDFIGGWTVCVGTEEEDPATMTIGETGSYTNTDDFKIYGTLINKGEIESGSDGGWVYNYGTIDNRGLFTSNFCGWVGMENEGVVKNSKTFVSNASYNNNGETLNTGVFTSTWLFCNNNKFINDGGTVNNNAVFENGSLENDTAVVTNDGGVFVVAGSSSAMLKNYGTFNNASGILFFDENANNTGFLWNYNCVCGGKLYYITSDYLVTGYTPLDGDVTVYPYAYLDIEGSGTESDPYKIDNAEKLGFFLTQDAGEYGQLTDSFVYNTDEYGVMNVGEDKDLDFNNKIVTIPNDVTNESHPIYIQADITFTMYGGTFIAGKLEGDAVADSAQTIGAKGAISTLAGGRQTVDIHDMTFYNAYTGNLCIHLDDVDTAKISKCVFHCSVGGGVQNGRSEVTIQDCEIYQDYGNNHNSSAVAVQWGDTTVTNVESGTYHSCGYGAYVYSSGGTINIHGGDWQADVAVLSASTSDDYDFDATINVYGGTFVGAFRTLSTEEATASINLCGGTFSGTGLELSAFGDYVATGFNWSIDSGDSASNYVFVVTPEATVSDATTGEIEYSGSLAGAIAVADDGDTVTIMDDVTLTADITIPNNIIITGETGEETITISASDKNFELSAEGIVTFTDLVFNVDDTIVATSPSVAGSSVIFDDCVFVIGGTDSACIVCGSTGSTTNVTIKNSAIEGDIRKATLVYLSGDSVFTFTGNTVLDQAPDENGSAMTVVMESETAQAVITGNTFTDLYCGICIDTSSASGVWTITGNQFVGVDAVLALSSENDFNKNFNLAYNYFGGALPVIMDSGASNAGYNESATIGGNTALKLTDAGIEFMNLTLYPYYADATLTSLVYEDVDQTVEDVVTDILTDIGSVDTEDKTAVNKAALLVALADTTTMIEEDETIIDAINDLDATFVEANGNITVDTDLAPLDTEDYTIEKAEVAGLGLAVYGGSVPADTAELTLEVEQIESDDDVDLAFTVAPYVSVNSDPATKVENDALNAPVTFKIYLPDIFEGNRATVVHTYSDNSGSETYNLTVRTDDNGDKYIQITVTQFSTFKVTGYTYTPSSGASYYASAVTSATNGHVDISSVRNALNQTVTITATPDDGFQVGDVSVAYASGREVTVTHNGDGTYSYNQPGASVTVAVTFVEIGSESGDDSLFTDVDRDAYYYDAMLWAVEHGITSGYSNGTFAPFNSCTRAQAVTFLWRAVGEPEATIDNPFSDVAEGMYYYDAVLWAVEHGIAKGTDDTTFSPNVDCTRAHIITFLWRLAGEPVVDSINPFTDVNANNYYYDAVLWAAGDGITDGTSDTTFGSNNDCTRAQIVVFLYRYLGI